MTLTRKRAMLLCIGIFVVMTLEQILFGRDTPGTAHDISVAAWFISLAAAAVFLALLVATLVTRVRRQRVRDQAPTAGI